MKASAALSRLIAGAAMLALAVPAAAQQAPQQQQRPQPPGPGNFEVPRATGYQEVLNLPDWTGVWYPDWSLLFGGRAAARPQLTPQAQAKLDAYNESIKAHGPDQTAQAQCLPPGIPGVMQQPYPIEILFSPGRVTILTEAYAQVRRIFTDGRPLPEDPDPFFNGNSVGHWEGDVLVIDSNGFHPQTTITAGVGHSDKMTVRERIFLQAPGELIDEMTITDPEVLTAPFVVRIAYKLDNSFPIREYVCAENNRLVSESGEGANIDLGLDDEEDPFGPAGE